MLKCIPSIRHIIEVLVRIKDEMSYTTHSVITNTCVH